MSATSRSLPLRRLSMPAPALCRSSRRAFSTTLQRDATWGFIGLGNMGYPMAKNLRAKIPASDTLIIRDVNKDVMQRFVEETKTAGSVEIADNPREVAEKAVSKGIFFIIPECRMHVVVLLRGLLRQFASVARLEAGSLESLDSVYRDIASSMKRAVLTKFWLTISNEEKKILPNTLPEPKHVKDVFHSILKDGDLPPLEQERLFIDTSTIDPGSSREIANAVHSTKQGRFVDAPMSGGVVGAKAGTLSFMFGASSQTGSLVERVKKVLLLMGKNAWHLGEQGAGVSGKLANNYLLAINNIATAEALNLGIRWGLDPKVLAEMINSSTGRCWPSEVNNPVPGVVETAPASRGYEGGFGISLMKKDLKLAIAAAQESGTPLELAATAQKLYMRQLASKQMSDLDPKPHCLKG
ncbi:hypothetical protein T310_5761 [Rasamsonia emersonii CBS 393.64]|uniref:3-hydroxyisobutyrate dehydrogenase n=1 Tax=Rasamsonia emersonii (strain ATCC 16479 / CBS 393.64 / IMI 116815) TaxID=1408163 RepID=A0A0F4YRI2_RASE3|nr:hypothetical protein T310_5761 [Rasamsonia emersonii CBS 393.64]KKA20218.1 hypothetical protein T310_5761 [Rasamsonia emersonii CBS 393.64]